MASIAGIKAGNAYVVIGAIDDTGKMLAKIGRNIKRWGASLTSLGTDVLFKGLMASFPVAGMLNWTADFDDKMKRVQARTGATDEEMNTLSKTARTVGRDIGFTAGQIASILDTLSQREFGLGDMQNMVRPIALLAKATGSGTEADTANAGRLMSQVLNSFNINAAESARVADILAVAANKSNFALDDLREAMSKVGPFAHQMGMSLEETVAIMAQMRNVEMEAETAGIAMRNILLNASDSKAVAKFNESLKSMGKEVIEFVDKAGNLKDPIQLLFEVFKILKTVGTAQRADLMGTLFGKRAAVPSMVAGASQKAFEDLMKQIENAAGEAERISKQMETGMGGAFRAIKTAVDSLAITIGKTLTPMIQGLRDAVVPLIDKLNAWVAANPRVAGSIVMVTAGVMAAGVAFIALGLSLKLVGAAITGFGLLLIGLKATVMAVVMTIATVGSILFTILGAIPPIIGFIITAITGIGSAIISMISGFATFMATLLSGASLPVILLVILNLFILIAGSAVILGAVAGKALRIVVDGVVALSQAIANAGKQIWHWLGDVWGRIKTAAKNAFAVLGAGLGAALQLAAVGKFQLAAETAMKAIKVAWLEVRNVMLDAWEEVRAKALTVMNHITAAIKTALSHIDEFILKLGIVIAVQEGQITPAQGMQMWQGVDLGAKMQRGLINAGRDVVPDADAKARRKAELDAARKEFEDQMKKIAPDLKDAKQIFDDLLKKLRPLGEDVPPGANPVQQAVGTGIKALDPLEKNTIEAAKAAYEAAVAGEMGGQEFEAQNAQNLADISTNTGFIKDNLQVA